MFATGQPRSPLAKMSDQSRTPLVSLQHALDVIEIVAAGGAVHLSEIARATGLGRSGAHKILQTLRSRGYVQQASARGTYSLGVAAWRLGILTDSYAALAEESRSVLAQLTEFTGETSHVATLDGLDIVYLGRAETTHAVKAYGAAGDRAPAHCVATGKVLLAELDVAEFESLVPVALRTFTPTSIGQRCLLLEQLEQVRVQGYAENRGEWRADVNGIAVPVGAARPEIALAVGISAPAYRLSSAHAEEFLLALREAAALLLKAQTTSRGGHVEFSRTQFRSALSAVAGTAGAESVGTPSRSSSLG